MELRGDADEAKESKVGRGLPFCACRCPCHRSRLSCSKHAKSFATLSMSSGRFKTAAAACSLLISSEQVQLSLEVQVRKHLGQRSLWLIIKLVQLYSVSTPRHLSILATGLEMANCPTSSHYTLA
jgi:hypothetical protein